MNKKFVVMEYVEDMFKNVISLKSIGVYETEKGAELKIESLELKRKEKIHSHDKKGFDTTVLRRTKFNYYPTEYYNI